MSIPVELLQFYEARVEWKKLRWKNSVLVPAELGVKYVEITPEHITLKHLEADTNYSFTVQACRQHNGLLQCNQSDTVLIATFPVLMEANFNADRCTYDTDYNFDNFRRQLLCILS